VIRAHAFYLRINKRTQEALEEFAPLLALEPRDAGLRVSYATLLDANGDIKGALRQYREAIRLEPDRAQPYHWAGAIAIETIGMADVGLRLVRHASRLDPDNPTIISTLAGSYMGLGEAELSRQALAELRRLGDTASLQLYDAAVAVVEGRPNDARSLLIQRLKNEPRDGYANILLWRLRGSSDEYRNTLRQVTQYRSLEPDDLRSDEPYSALVCLNAWLGDLEEANAFNARWEPVWRTRAAYGFTAYARNDELARSLACVGRDDDALTELEALVKEGYNIGWRTLAIDPAYDGIRSDPRFRAIIDQLKAADAAAGERFRARPDLNDADIESLGM
jgi:tetratricopeptide (TPR) repeat protein